MPDTHNRKPVFREDQFRRLNCYEYSTVSIARSFARERRRPGLSQVELARRAGVRPETINRLEAAKHVPSIATVDKIDRALREAEAETGDAGQRRAKT